MCSVEEAVGAGTDVAPGAAEACGVADREGRLAPGFDADVIAVDGDPTADAADLRAVTRCGEWAAASADRWKEERGIGGARGDDSPVWAVRPISLRRRPPITADPGKWHPLARAHIRAVGVRGATRRDQGFGAPEPDRYRRVEHLRTATREFGLCRSA